MSEACSFRLLEARLGWRWIFTSVSREPDEEFMSITDASVLVLEEWPSSQWFGDDEARLSSPRGC